MALHAETPSPAYALMIYLLSTLIASYEDVKYPIPAASPVQMLEHLMAERQLSQQELAKAIGISAPHLSNILSGTRDITLEQARKFGSFFSVSPALFLSL